MINRRQLLQFIASIPVALGIAVHEVQPVRSLPIRYVKSPQDIAERMHTQLVLRQLESCNQMLGVLFVKTFQTLPNVANQINATMKTMSRAIKECQQAAAYEADPGTATAKGRR